MEKQLVSITKEAGAMLAEMFRRGSGAEVVKEKSGFSPAIAADVAVEKFILESLKRSGFKGTVISEEAGRVAFGSESQVIRVDPLDGSRNYAHGIRHFCVSLALIEQGSTVLGVVFDPNLNELFVADARAPGFTLNGSSVRYAPDTGVFIVGVATDKRTLSKLSNSGGNGEYSDIRIRFGGSAALDLCYVACNRYSASVMTRVQPHDIAAGMLIAQKGGAHIKKLDGRTDATMDDPDLISATDPALIKRIAEILGH
ncbi:MAG: inositol monophosphatase [Candidatus Micrarchaeota archaeon]|nr:inositol monophosphatase [Candidatus Micrarchaeota archaeon]MDE1805035.1 inositol monophosphatase [Candidatus Micrarchaeota archaeon]MDE1847022.1 inositol monophosphatase [Candidatus Micrarchaeota archaeon]